jgi:gluconate 2-dehydrogenase gamma chain
MHRRDVLRTLGTAAIGAAAAPDWVASLTALAQHEAHTGAARTAAAATDWKPQVLTAHQNETVVVLTELIIPTTETPGAKETLVNRFVDGVLAEASAPDRDSFIRGLTWIDERSQALFKKPFAAASADDQTSLLTRLSETGNPQKEAQIGRDFFDAIKAMTINGYYTTEIGFRRELGDSGQLFQAVSQGCDHPEHQG